MMEQLDIVKKSMKMLKGSFINSINEIILIPKFNIYFRLDDVNNEADFKEKLCEHFSRSCCYSLPHKTDKANKNYHKKNCEIFNAICNTDFSVDDIGIIYAHLGNGCNHQLCYEFVKSNFNLEVLDARNRRET